MSATSNKDYRSSRSCISLVRGNTQSSMSKRSWLKRKRLVRFWSFVVSGGPSCRIIPFRSTYGLSDSRASGSSASDHYLAMKFIRCLRTPRCNISRRTAKFSPYGISFRRMASFYNVDIAGLTDEQVEVRKPSVSDDEILIILYDTSSETLLVNSPSVRLLHWQQR